MSIRRQDSAALATMAEPLVDPIVDVSDQFARSARELVRSADDYVHDNPWAAIGVVAVIGLTAGYLLSRRI